MRGVGNPQVDDNVSKHFACKEFPFMTNGEQFTIYFYYPAGVARPHPFTAILRAHILSVRHSQVRYVVRGTRGTYTKGGLDVQEDQLKVISTPQAILENQYGLEPQAIWGTLENLESDNVTVTTSR